VFVQQMREDQGRVAETLSKIETRVRAAPLLASATLTAGSQSGFLGSGPSISMRAPPPSGRALEELTQQLQQLQKTNEQLVALLAQAQAAKGGAGAAIQALQGLPRPGGGGQAPASYGFGGAGAIGTEDKILIASAAVEQRVRRLEDQIGNLDRGMAKCLGQVVRLLQGLY
jgi:hypothetical protein